MHEGRDSCRALFFIIVREGTASPGKRKLDDRGGQFAALPLHPDRTTRRDLAPHHSQRDASRARRDGAAANVADDLVRIAHELSAAWNR